MVNQPTVMIQNYQTVIDLTANLTSNQTLQAIRRRPTGRGRRSAGTGQPAGAARRCRRPSAGSRRRR
jgi:hypothetical protein